MSGHVAVRILVGTHRWLGIAIGFLFILWFLSGIVMIYARMPALEDDQRLARLPAIAPASIRVAPPAIDGDISRLVIGSIEGRPVYRLTTGNRAQHVFADSGDVVPAADAEQALRIARAFAGFGAVRYDTRLADADQWTFHVRQHVPLHRLAVDDGLGTHLYVTEHGGEVVARTTAAGRRWGWLGAVIHWLYFEPFRRQASLWSNTNIVLSVAGTVLCLAGLVCGVWRIFQAGDQRPAYRRALRWHHYFGVIFGVPTAMWVFSGLLSMDPWNWSPSTLPTREQSVRLAGGTIATTELTAERIRRAVEAFRPTMVKEIAIVKFRGRYYATAAEGVVAFDEPHLGAQEQLPPDLVIGSARVVMPDHQLDGMHWMEEYDAYYYDRDGRKSLPVLRVKYNDPQQTWLYIDPRRGTIVRKEERLSRINRWLYRGFHSFDFPFLYHRRPLWDITVIALSLGGLTLSLLTITAGWRRATRSLP